MRLRSGTPDDIPFLEEMLFEAFHWRADAPRPPFESFSASPEFQKLLAGWGRPGDAAVIALDEAGSRIGAAWYRRWTPEVHSYGFVDEETPELGIAVRKQRRSTGVGSALVAALLDAARASGVRAISLSVDPANPARRLYERLGFRKVGEEGTSWTLLAELRRPSVAVDEASSREDYVLARELFGAYARSLDFDLEFQGFAGELAVLPGEYAPPRGGILIARDGERAVGCVALRPQDPTTCEMKRLYTIPAVRRRGLGRALAEAVIRKARTLGYARMRLDTVRSMREANALYASLGFRRVAPYRFNPLPDAFFYELVLSGDPA